MSIRLKHSSQKKERAVTTKYTFKQEYSGYTGFATEIPPSAITMEINGELSLPQVLERFEEFLRGAGFYLDGHLDIVNDEELSTDFVEHSDSYFDTDRNR